MCTQWTQTVCSLPPVLPEEVERVLAGYFVFNEDQSSQPKNVFASSSNVVCSTQQVTALLTYLSVSLWHGWSGSGSFWAIAISSLLFLTISSEKVRPMLNIILLLF
jgi:hypothetical protein